jgi:hypothetical protein
MATSAKIQTGHVQAQAANISDSAHYFFACFST